MTTKLYHVICEWLRDLIEGTPWQGHLFAVGGCCRDEIMGFEIKDLDLAVDLPNGGIKFARWLQKKHLVIGHPIFFVKYGTAKLRLRRFPDDEIELVQTRKEQYTRETSRCPEVAFGTIEEDCYRRDFTVNSLYYDITRRKTVDITGLGIPDMEAGLLRTPMDPDETFNDDPVRILRGLRFANRFGWTIHPPVRDALLRHIHRLDIVSRERVHSELCKMLNGPDPVGIMETLRRTGALEMMIPPITALYNNLGAWPQAMNRLADVIARDPEAPTRFRLAAIFIGLAPKAADAAKLTRFIMHTLRFDRPIVSDVAFLVRYSDLSDALVDNPRQVRAMQNLASVQRRMELFVRFLADLGRPETAARLQAASQRLVDAGKSGFSDTDKSDKSDKSDRSDKKRRRRHRGGRRRRRGGSSGRKNQSETGAGA